jgi:protein-tyrosine phosphatase
MSLATADAAPIATPARDPGRALLWLILCGGLFYAGYGFANWAAAQRDHVASIRFGWEQGIPFLPWTILPYWSIDLFYVLAFFLCADAVELRRLARRILTAQGVAVLCFLVFPLQLDVAKPATDGVTGFLFTVLGSFDLPYNQAPSLHIALLVILWDLYARHLPRRFHVVLHAWSALIGISVLTTYQHHFIDLPTGAALGLLCLWFWPDSGAMRFRLTRCARRRRIAALYALGAGVCVFAALFFGGWALWLLWPALALALVAVIYLAFGAAGFQKRAGGTIPLATRLLLAPYLVGARLNARLWTRSDAQSEIGDNVWLGRLPHRPAADAPRFAAIIDLCAELPAAPHAGHHVALPALDLIPLSAAERDSAVAAIEAARTEGAVLVACALGYGRSAAAVAGWLVATGRAPSPEVAVERLRAIRPHIALDPRRLP